MGKLVRWLFKSNRIGRNLLARVYWQIRVENELWRLKKQLAVDPSLNNWMFDDTSNKKRRGIYKKISRLEKRQNDLRFWYESKNVEVVE